MRVRVRRDARLPHARRQADFSRHAAAVRGRRGPRPGQHLVPLYETHPGLDKPYGPRWDARQACEPTRTEASRHLVGAGMVGLEVVRRRPRGLCERAEGRSGCLSCRSGGGPTDRVGGRTRARRGRHHRTRHLPHHPHERLVARNPPRRAHGGSHADYRPHSLCRGPLSHPRAITLHPATSVAEARQLPPWPHLRPPPLLPWRYLDLPPRVHPPLPLRLPFLRLVAGRLSHLNPPEREARRHVPRHPRPPLPRPRPRSRRPSLVVRHPSRVRGD